MTRDTSTSTSPGRDGGGGANAGADTAVPLRIRGLRTGYGTKLILDGVDMEIPPGEIRVVLGGSGSGKSTLLRAAAGLERPWSGTVELFGQPLDWEQGRPSDEALGRIGVLFQGGALISSLTVEDNVALPLRIHNPGLPRAALRELARIKLRQVSLDGAGGKFPGELSGGMRKRAGLARAMAADPALLFCDEPSAGLDPVTSRGLDELLLELRDTLGITMMVVTHELDSIRAIADQITFLSGGKVIFAGTLQEAASGPEEVRDFLDRRPPRDSGRQAEAMAFHREN